MNKYKYERIWLQEIMTENKMLKLSISHATRCIDDYVYVLGIIRRYGLISVIDKVKLSPFLVEYGISFKDYLVNSSLLNGFYNKFKSIYNGKLKQNKINHIQKIVNILFYISRCANNGNLNQNTSINKPKTTHELQNDIKAIEPIPNKNTDSYSQKMDNIIKSVSQGKKATNSSTIKKRLNKWIAKEYKPTHFLTVQLPENKKTKDLYNSISHLRNIMKAFEKSLMNNWEHHHLRFIAFAENGISSDWHFHILFNRGRFSEQELQDAIFQAMMRENLPSYCMNLKPIEPKLLNVTYYCMKEIKIYWNGKFDSDHMIFSEDLFNLNPQRN